MGSRKIKRSKSAHFTNAGRKKANRERVQQRRIRRLATSPVFLDLVPAQEGATS